MIEPFFADCDESVRVQDDSREQQIRELFGLVDPRDGRSGVDAVDSFGNPFELKSTTVTGVSTSRDVGSHTISRWKNRYWIFVRGRNLAAGFIIDESYFLHPHDMSEFFDELQKRFEPGDEVWAKAKAHLSVSFARQEVDRLDRLINRGNTLNNPKIPWDYIVKNGTNVFENHAAVLQDLVLARPLDSKNEPKETKSWQLDLDFGVSVVS